MLEITNLIRSPVQIMVRSKTAPIAFTTLSIPGVGSGKNTIQIKDEMATDYARLEKDGLISVKNILDNKLRKGE